MVKVLSSKPNIENQKEVQEFNLQKRYDWEKKRNIDLSPRQAHHLPTCPLHFVPKISRTCDPAGWQDTPSSLTSQSSWLYS